MLTRPQLGYVGEWDKQAMLGVTLHVYQLCVQEKQLQGQDGWATRPSRRTASTTFFLFPEKDLWEEGGQQDLSAPVVKIVAFLPFVRVSTWPDHTSGKSQGETHSLGKLLPHHGLTIQN